MKHLCVVILVGVLLWVATGCGSGLVHSHADRMRRVRTLCDLDRRTAIDDWDYFWLMDQPTKLTRWHLLPTK